MKQICCALTGMLGILLAAFVGPEVAAANQPPFEWKESESTPDASLKHEEVMRLDEQGEVHYKLFARGVPRNKNYELWMKWIDGDIGSMPFDITIEESGELKGNVKGSKVPLVIPIHDIRETEPIKFALVSRDKSIKVFDKIIAFPVEAKSPDGCSLGLELIAPNGLNFVIQGQGFEPGEEVTTRSESSGEVIVSKVSLSNGVFFVVMNPGVTGKRGGTATFSASGRSCTVTLAYRWGKAMRVGGVKPEE